MSDYEQLQYPDTLESFKKERERYRPKDLIDFSIEYFKALQSGTPLRYKDLSGLEKLHINPEDYEIIERLGIPEEDLYRVINRRKNLTEKDLLNKFNEEIKKYDQLIESNGDKKLDEKDMHNYLKFKKNTFQEIEFLRFIDGLENITLDGNNRRIYFTKFFKLTQEQKNAVIDLLSLDIKIIKNFKIYDWKDYLIKMDESSKHTYVTYDKVSYKLEEICKKIDNNEKIDSVEAEKLYNKYTNLFESIIELDENELYNVFISKYQFERIILYSMTKIKYLKNGNLKELFDKVEKIFNNSFAYLTVLDYYDFILNCFIPLLKNSVKTSQEHREMESFLNRLVPQIPYIYNTNFEEEKSLYYNIECVKYFLNKESRIKTLPFKKILIELIHIFVKKASYLKEKLNIKDPSEITKIFKDKLELLTLQLNEFYPNLVGFTNKLISISIKYNINEGNSEIKDSMISEFKSYEHIDQVLITNSMNMFKLFETDSDKQKGIDDVIELLIKSFSIPEMNDAIKSNKRNEEEIIQPLVKNFYKKIINIPRYDFNNLKYLKFKDQNQIISLIIKNNKNLENTGLFYDKDNIQPFLNYNNMIEEIFNFSNLYFKLIFDKSIKDMIQNDSTVIINKFKNNFKKENEYVDSLPTDNENQEFIDKFKEFNNFQQKLILTYLNFIDNINCENKYLNIIKLLSIIYLKPKIDFVTKKILQEKEIKLNKIFLDCIFDDLKHVNYPIFIYVQYDKDINLFLTFTKEEQEIIEKIEQTIKLDPNFHVPNCLPFKDLLEGDDLDKVIEDIKENHKLINEYIKLYNPDDKEAMLTDFSIFNGDERRIIIKILDKKEGKDVSILKDYDNKNEEKNKFVLKKIVSAETDRKLSKSVELGNDIKFYYRKELLKTEKDLTDSKKSFISSILDYPYDPNNTYIINNFMNFTKYEKITVVEDILARMKITNYKTLYYSILASNINEELLRDFIDIGKRHNDNDIFMKKVNEEFLFLVHFFDYSVLKFILEIDSVENQTIYKFTNNFTDKERKTICVFLELYSLITKKNRYNDFKEELNNYLEDLSYNQRLEDINNKLDKIINNEEVKYMFIITAEQIKETSLEIDYIIEELISNENNDTLSPLVKNLFERLKKPERNILIKSLKCIIEQGGNQKLKGNIEELEQIKDKSEKESIYKNINDSFGAIKKEISESKDKDEVKEPFQKLKYTLNSICYDLFKFVEDCKKGNYNLRKIKAISPDKVEIIKTLLDIEYMFHKTDNLKNAIDLLRNLNLN